MTARRLALALLLALCAATAFGKATIIVINGDAAGIGFNDPTPAVPVGGNTGVTIGEQRLQAFNEAARIWGQILDSTVEIRIGATFVGSTILPCSATTATLGDARTAVFIRDFAKAPVANTFYPVALANKLAGKDLTPGSPHIVARFSSALGTPGCGLSWYYGLDNDHKTSVDLVTVLLHEFGHGLGFAGSVNSSTGVYGTSNTPAIFDLHVLDEVSGLRFDQMSDAQRKVAITNSGRLVWNGDSVRAAAATFLGSSSSIDVGAAGGITTYELGTASFGSGLTVTGLSAPIVAALDDANVDGPTTTDGCTALTNASAMAGKLALVDRGTCTFVTKAKNAQNAGAVGVIVVDNRVNTPPGMSGTDATITIPVVSVTQADGGKIRSQLAGATSGRIFTDLTRHAGASRLDTGMVRLYAPGTVESGSSLYHFDTTAFPNLLMEPSISGDLLHRVDLTVNELIDIGWAASSNSGGTPLPTPIGGRTILKHPKH